MRYSTARTSSIRSGSASRSGTRNGMRASTIFLFARTSRCAIVASGTRNARAISPVVRPATERSVSATCASRASAGWQHVKMSSSRSSGRALAVVTFGSSSSAIFSSYRFARRSRSMPLRLAVVMSHAPGLAGTPSRGQCSSAATSASCTHSSARSKSPRLRTRAAVSRPASSRKTAATASCVIVLVALSLHRRADLDVAHRPCFREADRIIQVGDLDQRVAADLFLRLDERSVEDLHLPAHASHRRRGLADIQPLAALDDGLVLFPPLADRGHPAVHRFLRSFASLLVADEHQHVVRQAMPPTYPGS